MLLIDGGNLSFSTATYTVVICCSVRIWLHMRQAFATVAGLEASRARAVANQLNVVLVFQAVTPLCVEIVPICFLSVASLSGEPTTVSSSTTTLCLNWAPLINAASVILIVRPYRRALVNAWRGKESSTTTAVAAVRFEATPTTAVVSVSVRGCTSQG